MAISKKASKLHQEALGLASVKRQLTDEEREFIIENFDEGAAHLNRLSGAFFTPLAMTEAIQIEIDTGDTVIDLCAGIGNLSYYIASRMKRIVCVEGNPDYVAIGKKVVPEAEWICGDVFDVIAQMQGVNRFNIAISNPPFGRLATPTYKGALKSATFEHKVIDAAADIANVGIFILPQGSAGYFASRQLGLGVVKNTSASVTAFEKDSGLFLEAMPIDTREFADQWNSTSPNVEFSFVDYTARRRAGQMNLLAA